MPVERKRSIRSAAAKPQPAARKAPRALEDSITDDVISRIANAEDARLKQVMTAFIRHLHGFIREVEPSEAEWMQAIQFLAAVGKKCDGIRQEFILLSDTLGATMLIDAINHRKPRGATESSVLGPFYREGAPEIGQGADISLAPGGEPCIVRGRVTDPKGAPIAGALLDIWQTAANGMYEGQDPDQPSFNLRGKLKTDSGGRYLFRTVLPVCYPIPDDGPVGQLLRATGRHPYRPAHIHFIVSAEGYETVVTQVFSDADPYIGSDAVFGVKDSLIVHFDRHDSEAEASALGVSAPFYTLDYDFGLAPAS
ncbi:MAG: intradiol ring-cleavage dioxygenase [Alphaproteobacteria bacterium]